MGDGVVNKYALIINGDTEQRHLNNVRWSAEILKGQGYETFVASPSEPARNANHYLPPRTQNISLFISDINGRIDDDDLLVIYTTGHGGEDCLDLEDECVADQLANLLDIQTYGQRTIIMDQCYSGNWVRFFSDDPRTLFISAGSENESVCCGQFAPYFWSTSIRDLNGNGEISWQERYAYTQAHVTRSTPQSVATAGYIQDSPPPFDAGIENIGTQEELTQALGRLQEGQYAVVYFSAPWCPYCRTYNSIFESLAEESGGRYMFLKVEDDEDEVAHQYGVNSFPTVLIIDSQGESRGVRDRNRALAEVMRIENPAVALQETPVPPTVARPQDVLEMLMAGRTDINVEDLDLETLYVIAGNFHLDSAVRNNARRFFDSKLAGTDLTTVRSCFTNVDGGLRWIAIDHYGERWWRFFLRTRDLTQEQHTEMLAGVKALSEMFSDRVDGRRAVMAYMKFAYYLSPDEIADSAALLRESFVTEDQKVIPFYVESYAKLAKNGNLDADEAAKGLEAIKELMVNYRNYRSDSIVPFEWIDTVLNAYADVVRPSRHYRHESEGFPGEITEAARLIREMFIQGDYPLSRIAISVYGTLADKVSPDEAIRGAATLRSFFGNPDGSYEGQRFARLASNAYERLLMSMNEAGLWGESVAFTQLFSFSETHEWRYNFFHACQALAERLNPDDAKRIVRVLPRIFGNEDESGSIRIDTLKLYAKLLVKLEPEDIAAADTPILELFDDDNESVRREALIAYRDIAEKLMPADLAEGLEALEDVMDDSNCIAGAMYRRLSGRL